MKIDCAWCNTEITVNSVQSQSIEETISHSICLTCMSDMAVVDEINLNGNYHDDDIMIPFGTIVLDKQDIIRSFNTFRIDTNSTDVAQMQDLIGKDYFKDLLPFLRSIELSHTIGGLKRRKSIGEHEQHYILRFDHKLQFVEMRLTHYPNPGETTVELNLVREQKLKRD